MQPDQFKTLLNTKENLEHFTKMLPKHLSVEKFVSTATTYFAYAAIENPKILEASQRSLLLAVHKAARDGLLLDGNESCFMCFANKKSGTVEAQYSQMVEGLKKLIRNAGALNVFAELVYENDEFDFYTEDGAQRLKHIIYSSKNPKMAKDRGKKIAVYAVADLGNNVRALRYCDLDEILKAKSHSKNSTYWTSSEDDMWKKTALRRLAKNLEKSSEIKIQDDDLTENEDKLNPESKIVIEQSPPELDKIVVEPAPSTIKTEPPKSLYEIAKAIGAKSGREGLREWYINLPNNNKEEVGNWLQEIIDLFPLPEQVQSKANISTKLASVVHQQSSNITDPNSWEERDEEQGNTQYQEGDYF